VQHPHDDIKQPEHAGGSGLPRTERLDGPPVFKASKRLPLIGYLFRLR